MTAAVSPPKKERNAAETKKRILDAAGAEFATKGFDGARLGAIARAAGIQQPLIHHYFVDKETLHAEVLRSGVAAMVEDVWAVLGEMDPRPARKKRRGIGELRATVELGVDALLRFCATNGALLWMLRHEARDSTRGQRATRLVAEKMAPLFAALASRLDEMKARGELRSGFDSKQLVLSVIAMVAFPFEEETFVSLLWPSSTPPEERLEERKRHVVDMILRTVSS